MFSAPKTRIVDRPVNVAAKCVKTGDRAGQINKIIKKFIRNSTEKQ